MPARRASRARLDRVLDRPLALTACASRVPLGRGEDGRGRRAGCRGTGIGGSDRRRGGKLCRPGRAWIGRDRRAGRLGSRRLRSRGDRGRARGRRGRGRSLRLRGQRLSRRGTGRGRGRRRRARGGRLGRGRARLSNGKRGLLPRGEERQGIHVPLRIGGEAHAEVDVGLVDLGLPARPDRPHRLSLGHLRPLARGDRPQMDERDRVAVVGLDGDGQAVPRHRAGEGDGAGGRGSYRRPLGAADIDPSVLTGDVGIRPQRERAEHGAVGRPAPGAGRPGEERHHERGEGESPATHASLLLVDCNANAIQASGLPRPPLAAIARLAKICYSCAR